MRGPATVKGGNRIPKGGRVIGHWWRWCVVVLVALGAVYMLFISPRAPPAAEAVAPEPQPGEGTRVPTNEDGAPSVVLADACTYTNYTNDVEGHKAHLSQLLRHILSFGPRVGGSSSSGYFGVMASLVSMMQCGRTSSVPLGAPQWVVSFDNFTDTTPIGAMQFTNLIASIENPYFVNGDAHPMDRTIRRTFPRGKGRKRLEHLVLAAHWDSKLMHDRQPFLGACDSVVPMIIILELMKMVAHTLHGADDSRYLHAIARNLLPRKVTVVFFDGEEAFVDWKGRDHTYGSRHLAALWRDNGMVKDIDLFALLDLMGPAGMVFHNYFPQDSGAFFEGLHVVEKRLRTRNRLLTPSTAFPNEPAGYPSKVDDDHIHWVPHVPVLHMIPIPFPRVWHTPRDDASAIDWATTIDLLHILAHGLLSFPVK